MYLIMSALLQSSYKPFLTFFIASRAIPVIAFPWVQCLFILHVCVTYLVYM